MSETAVKKNRKNKKNTTYYNNFPTIKEIFIFMITFNQLYIVLSQKNIF